jgi:hypothetical protein
MRLEQTQKLSLLWVARHGGRIRDHGQFEISPRQQRMRLRCGRPETERDRGPV